MTYVVIYQMPDGRRIRTEVVASNDSEYMIAALAAMPPGATLDGAEFPEAA